MGKNGLAEHAADSIAPRRLRANATPEESALWDSLRDRKLAGHKFRRQQRFDRFVLDFYCPAARLAIELDGSQHATAQGLASDAERDAYLAGHQVRVLRFANREARQDMAGVLARILEACDFSVPLPSAGEGQRDRPQAVAQGEGAEAPAADRDGDRWLSEPSPPAASAADPSPAEGRGV